MKPSPMEQEPRPEKNPKKCVFCGKVDAFLMTCPHVCLHCGDLLQADYGLTIQPKASVQADEMVERAAKGLAWITGPPGFPRYDNILDKISGTEAARFRMQARAALEAALEGAATIQTIRRKPTCEAAPEECEIALFVYPAPWPGPGTYALVKVEKEEEKG